MKWYPQSKQESQDSRKIRNIHDVVNSVYFKPSERKVDQMKDHNQLPETHDLEEIDSWSEVQVSYKYILYQAKFYPYCRSFDICWTGI